MTDETRQDWQPPTLPEQTAEAGHTGPLPDVPDDAYAPDAEPLPPAEDAALDDTGHDADSLAGDFTDPDTDLSDLLHDDDTDEEETDDEDPPPYVAPRGEDGRLVGEDNDQ